MLVKHVRDVNNRPFATLVAKRGNIGVAICRSNEKFIKTEGIKVASLRADVSSGIGDLPIPNRYEPYFNDVFEGPIMASMEEILKREVKQFQHKSKEYFKNNPSG